MNARHAMSGVRKNRPGVHFRQTAGFTLVELLVVIGIISLLVTLLLPSITSARKSSQRTAGVINMRSTSTLLSSYADAAKGIWYNPMVTSNLDVFGFNWNPNFNADGFMAYGASLLNNWSVGRNGAIQQAFSPADGTLNAAYAQSVAQHPDLTHNWTWPTSFYYSPTMYRNRKIFTTGDEPFRVIPDPPCISAPKLNTIADVAFPSAKVVLYERKDFLQPTRSKLNKDAPNNKPRVEPLPPAFNSPKANINVMAADGSGQLVRLSALTARADKGLAEGDWTYLPVDHMGIPNEMGTLCPPDGQDEITSGATIDNHDAADSDAFYLYFFAGTRDGVRGRDLFN
jgi:prepilin-type N-terminal cleavage/methylation domain-containing protein